MKFLLTNILVFLVVSCIPLQIAPKIEGGKVFAPKKFKKQLPYNYVYVFEDPKDANEFYDYINAKFQIVYDDDTGNIPVIIDDKSYYITFYEVERATTTLNLLPMAVDAALEEKGHGPFLESTHTSRSGTWYIALTMTDETILDALNPNYKNHVAVLAYTNALRNEYLTTVHYIEVYLKNKPTQ